MRRSVPLALALLVAAMFAACGRPPRIALPSGQGTPIADFAPALDSASAACRGVRTLQAELALSGHAGRQRLRGRVLAGLLPDALRIEAVSPFGSPAFILTADGAEGRLWMGRERRVVDAVPPADILDALIGIPLSAGDLFALMAGCVKASVEPIAGRAYGADWIAVDLEDRATIYLRRRAGAWRIAAASYAGLEVEYGDAANGLPSRVRISSPAGPERADVDVTLTVRQAEANGALDAAQLTSLTVPAGTTPMSLDELRAASPLH